MSFRTPGPVNAPHGDNSAKPQPSDAPFHRIRVLLADDHKILREGIASLLEGYDDIEVIGEAEDGVRAVEMALQLEPDVVVMDISMPRLNGVDATEKITQSQPQIRVIGLSMHDEGDMAGALRRAGGTAYLTKGGPVQALIDAIRTLGTPAPGGQA